MRKVNLFYETSQNALTTLRSALYINTNNANRKVLGVGKQMSSSVKNARTSTGLSIEEAAKRLGISAGYLSQIENGQRQVSADRADEVAKLYGMKKEEIFLASRYAIRVVGSASSA
jgi:ribosome-binding protein aMBF1 (putative translation factor)